jgi:hypothetical protein
MDNDENGADGEDNDVEVSDTVGGVVSHSC